MLGQVEVDDALKELQAGTQTWALAVLPPQMQLKELEVPVGQGTPLAVGKLPHVAVLQVLAPFQVQYAFGPAYGQEIAVLKVLHAETQMPFPNVQAKAPELGHSDAVL